MEVSTTIHNSNFMSILNHPEVKEQLFGKFTIPSKMKSRTIWTFSTMEHDAYDGVAGNDNARLDRYDEYS